VGFDWWVFLILISLWLFFLVDWKRNLTNARQIWRINLSNFLCCESSTAQGIISFLARCTRLFLLFCCCSFFLVVIAIPMVVLFTPNETRLMGLCYGPQWCCIRKLQMRKWYCAKNFYHLLYRRPLKCEPSIYKLS
jgi:hypothetical protein